MWSRTGVLQAAALAAMVACPALDGSARADAPSQAADTLPQAADALSRAADTLPRAADALPQAADTRPSAPDTLPQAADNIVDYRISVTLDTDNKQLQGREHVTWRNPSSDAVPDLWFHLYLNAFQNTASTFMRESGGQLRGAALATGGWGWSHVASLRLAGGTDLLPGLHFQSPDDGNADDRTVASVRLPSAVKPGETIAFDLAFTAKLPEVFARTGYSGDYFLVGQWFPKLAVYEPAGMRGRTTGGWNCHQFHASSEFYADFGHYLVDFTVPARFVVGATGLRVDRRDNGNGTVTYVYDQSNVHDFVWTASPHFVEVKRRFEAAREVSPAEYARAAQLLHRTLDEVKLRDFDITFLMQPSHMPQLERHVRAIMLAVKSFGLSYGYYPHPTLTIVDPPYGAGGSGGMEYPTFITAGTSALLNDRPFTHINVPEEVTIHEFGHQYFQGMLASNEFEEAWLDEGINSYATGRVMEEGYGADATLIRFLGWTFSGRDLIRLLYTPDAIYDPIRQAAWKYSTAAAYGFNSYQRPELMLRTLEHYLGAETMARAMRTYAERWRFKHPGTDDFLAVMSEVAGHDLRPRLLPVIDRGEIVDYEIGSVASEPSKERVGFFETPPSPTPVKPAEASATRTDTGAKPPDASAKPGAAAKAGPTAKSPAAPAPMFDTTVVVRRRGEAIWPIDIAFKFAGQPLEHVAWDGQARWKRYDFHRPQKLEWVDIDPDRRIELDVDWLKNAERVEPDRRAAVRLTSRWLLVVQQLLSSIGM